MALTTETTSINWEVDNTSGLVHIPTHSMYLRAAGPKRAPGAPVIIVEAGLGSSSKEWTTVAREISSFARIYTYDRSGYGSSELSPLKPRFAENLAMELWQLLAAAGVTGPYIVVSHSYGGIIAREFLALEKENIVGMVFVDTNTEFSYKVRPEGLQEALEGLVGDRDFHELIGLGHRHKMSAEEWAGVKSEESEEGQKKLGEAVMGESEEYEKSCDILGEKNQFENRLLGNKPVSVVKGNNEKDIKVLLDFAVKEGTGTEEQRGVIRRWLEIPAEELKLQEDQLKLSTKGRLVHAKESGHDVQCTEPEIITEEVRWILATLKEDNQLIVDGLASK